MLLLAAERAAALTFQRSGVMVRTARAYDAQLQRALLRTIGLLSYAHGPDSLARDGR